MHAFIVDQAKLIVMWSAKCACSSVKGLVYAYLGQRFTDPKRVHKWETYSQNIDWDNLGKYKDYTIVWVCRNPYQRLVSGFINKYLPGQPLHDRLPPETRTFEGFVHALVAGEYFVDMHHFMPQTSELGWVFMKNLESSVAKTFDCVASVNELDKVSEGIARCFGVKALSVPRLNSTVYSGTKVKEHLWNISVQQLPEFNLNVAAFYNANLMKRVAEMYRNDFALMARFGYRFDTC